jgi:hypothetical protein
MNLDLLQFDAFKIVVRERKKLSREKKQIFNKK